jgi:outer membrane protein OmpA-like peptidoglycan-associated protein
MSGGRGVPALRVLCVVLLLAAAAAAAPNGAASGAAASGVDKNASLPRYLVYFDEFSAYLSPRSKTIIARVAKRAQKQDAKKIIVQARASATGTVLTNKYLAETRSSIVADQLEADGVPKAMITQQPIGQTGSTDPSVYDRRVDIILVH